MSGGFGNTENQSGAGMPEISAAPIDAPPIQPMTYRVMRERDHLRSRLAEVEAVLATIEAHPEVQQVIDALATLHLLR